MGDPISLEEVQTAITDMRGSLSKIKSSISRVSGSPCGSSKTPSMGNLFSFGEKSASCSRLSPRLIQTQPIAPRKKNLWDSSSSSSDSDPLIDEAAEGDIQSALGPLTEQIESHNRMVQNIHFRGPPPPLTPTTLSCYFDESFETNAAADK